MSYPLPWENAFAYRKKKQLEAENARLQAEVDRLREYCKDVTLLKAELDQLRFENKRMKKGLPPSDDPEESDKRP